MDQGERRRWGRRAFLAGSGVVAGGLAVGGLGACAGDEGDDGDEGAGGDGGTGGDGGVRNADVPSEATIFGWVSDIVDQGVRRPGYPADAWATEFIADTFHELGLEFVRYEPAMAKRWEPTDWSLEVEAGGESRTLDCFPIPYAPPVDGLEAELVAYAPDGPGGAAAVDGRAALADVELIAVPADAFLRSGSAPEDVSRRVVDPDGTLEGATHLTPLATGMDVDGVAEAGGVAFLGVRAGYPGDSCNVYVPYDAEDLPIPGAYLRGSDGEWLHARLAEGPVRVRFRVESTLEEVETHNVVGELAGADNELVVIGSHHDGPWASAVEDASGTALVLAQATYWAAQPEAERPHRLVFVLHAAHMAGWVGQRAFVAQHADELGRAVLEVHLEHAAREFVADGDDVVATGLPVPRWFFTSRNPGLEDAVYEALEAERLDRSMILAPDAIDGRPPTDGVGYYDVGVPIVNFLGAPFYLFDEMDTLDKVDREGLVPLTRAVARIVAATGGVTAAEMREAAG